MFEEVGTVAVEQLVVVEAMLDEVVIGQGYTDTDAVG